MNRDTESIQIWRAYCNSAQRQTGEQQCEEQDKNHGFQDPCCMDPAQFSISIKLKPGQLT